MKKKWKMLLLTLGIIIAAVLLILLVGVRVYMRVRYNDFYSVAEKEYKIPGLGDGLIVQGIAYDPEEDCYFQCGYMKEEGSASRVYMVYDDSSKTKYVTMRDTEGNVVTAHAGGIAVFKDYVWLCGSDDHIECFARQDFVDASDGGEVKCRASFRAITGPASVFTDGEYLWVSEFYREQNYPTEETHHLTTPADDKNYGIAIAYRIDSESETGVEEKPVCAVSLPGLVQGFIVTNDGKVAISRSYAIATSTYELYDVNVKAETSAATTIELGGYSLPLYYLSSDHLEKCVKMPPMSEDMELVGDDVVIMYESATKKYIFGNLYSGMYTYRMPAQ